MRVCPCFFPSLLHSSKPRSDSVPTGVTHCFSPSPQIVLSADDLPGVSLVVSLLADKLSWSWLFRSPYDDLVSCTFTRLGSVTANYPWSTVVVVIVPLSGEECRVG